MVFSTHLRDCHGLRCWIGYWANDFQVFTHLFFIPLAVRLMTVIVAWARHTSSLVSVLQPVWRKILREKFENSVTLFPTYALLPSGDLKAFGQGESEMVSFYLATFSCIVFSIFPLIFSLLQKSGHFLNLCKVLMSCGKEFHGLTINSEEIAPFVCFGNATY